jgi:hypothetical protein
MNRSSSVISTIGIVLPIVSAGHHGIDLSEVGSVAGPLLALSLDAGLASALIDAGW